MRGAILQREMREGFFNELTCEERPVPPEKSPGVLRGKVSQTEGTAGARALRRVFGLEMARTAVTGTTHEV